MGNAHQLYFTPSLGHCCRVISVRVSVATGFLSYSPSGLGVSDTNRIHTTAAFGIFFYGGVKQHYDVSSRAADCPRRITRTGAVHGRLYSSSTWLPPLLQLHHLRFDCHVVATTSLDGGGECRRHQRMGCSSPCGNFSPAPMPVPGSPCDLESLPQHFVPTNTKVSSGFAAAFSSGLIMSAKAAIKFLTRVGTMR